MISNILYFLQNIVSLEIQSSFLSCSYESVFENVVPFSKITKIPIMYEVSKKKKTKKRTIYTNNNVIKRFFEKYLVLMVLY